MIFCLTFMNPRVKSVYIRKRRQVYRDSTKNHAAMFVYASIWRQSVTIAGSDVNQFPPVPRFRSNGELLSHLPMKSAPWWKDFVEIHSIKIWLSWQGGGILGHGSRTNGIAPSQEAHPLACVRGAAACCLSGLTAPPRTCGGGGVSSKIHIATQHIPAYS